jgi:peptidoglycan hydrolase CwlO-like protein
MTDNRVVVEYQQPVDRGPDQFRRFVGERYEVTDAATAEAVHPKAKILQYADGRKFVRTEDESLAEVREAEAKAAEREAAKAAKAAESAKTSAGTSKDASTSDSASANASSAPSAT